MRFLRLFFVGFGLGLGLGTAGLGLEGAGLGLGLGLETTGLGLGLGIGTLDYKTVNKRLMLKCPDRFFIFILVRSHMSLKVL